MTKPKHVASTLTNILDNPVLMQVMDKNSDVRDWIPVIDEYWKCDLEKRKPSPAEFDDEGNLIKAGSYDMASFIYSLYDRECVIEIPEYKSSTPTKVEEGRHKVSLTDRRGRVIGVTSNADTFNFSIRIVDENIVSAETYGYPRNYKITDEFGEWYDGWKALTFVPTLKENKFLTENKLWNGSNIPFDVFVTPEKWISLYGQYYFITKVAVTRLAKELKFLKEEDDTMVAMGIKAIHVGSGNDNTPWKGKSSPQEKGERIRVACNIFEVDVPDYDLDFDVYPHSPEVLTLIRQKKKLVRKALSKFRFMCRCIELAACNKGINIFPSWIQNVKWEPGFRTKPRARTTWDRLKIIQPGVGELSVAIRRRVIFKSFTVKKRS